MTGNLNTKTIGDGNGGSFTAAFRLDPATGAQSPIQTPAAFARTPLSTTLSGNVGALSIPAGGGRLDVVNPDPTNMLYGSWDAPPTAGAAAVGVYPIGVNGGGWFADGVQGTFYLWSANATANVTANLWS